MNPASLVAGAAWLLVAARLTALGARSLRTRPARARTRPAQPHGWRPRVTSGCGR